MAQEIFEIILKWAIPTVLTAVASATIAYVRGVHKRSTDHEKAMEDGLQSLLRAEIIRANDKYIDQGYCPIYAKEALKRSYQAYHTLGGNDVATKLFEDVMHLPENQAQ